MVIVGYAYACPFRSRLCYNKAAEESVYVRNSFRGFGVGRYVHPTYLHTYTEKERERRV